MPDYKDIETAYASLSYTVYGENSGEVLLFFPGFGQGEQQYKRLVYAYAEQYKVIVVDLFFHGNSKWLKLDTPVSVEEWNQLVEMLLRKEHIETFSLMGFSMGARFAMLTTTLYPCRVKRLKLAAPDGITLNRWYKIAVENSITRGLFKNVILKNSSWLRGIAERISRLGLLDKKVYRFSSSQLQSQQQRERVYYSWVVFRYIQVNISLLARQLNEHKIAVEFYMGERDRIITLKRIEPLKKLLPDSILMVLPSGHTHLLDDIAKTVPGTKYQVP